MMRPQRLFVRYIPSTCMITPFFKTDLDMPLNSSNKQYIITIISPQTFISCLLLRVTCVSCFCLPPATERQSTTPAIGTVSPSASTILRPNLYFVVLPDELRPVLFPLILKITQSPRSFALLPSKFRLSSPPPFRPFSSICRGFRFGDASQQGVDFVFVGIVLRLDATHQLVVVLLPPQITLATETSTTGHAMRVHGG